jgi:dynactin complex subunit
MISNQLNQRQTQAKLSKFEQKNERLKQGSSRLKVEFGNSSMNTLGSCLEGGSDGIKKNQFELKA